MNDFIKFINKEKNNKIDNDYKKMYEEFNQKFTWDIIKRKKDKEFLNYVFLGEIKQTSLVHFLEYNKNSIKFAGSIKGGSAYKYFIYFDSAKTKKWKTIINGIKETINEIKAMEIGNKIKMQINFIINEIKTNKGENLQQVYEHFEDDIQLIVNKAWFLKYLHMLFPDYFSCFYSEKKQEQILDYLSIETKSSNFLRNIQINSFRKKLGISNVHFNKIFNDFESFKKQENNENEKQYENKYVAQNIIIYGVPGCGKSYLIKNEYLNDEYENESKRILFHPDYTYSDFVGQIKPFCINDKITYKFKPGPFTIILKEAIENPEQNFFLIIEEINRGNAPAIFGDIFQLLDRNRYGESEYSIFNEDIALYVYGNENKSIKIPQNLSLIGTMNSSDQNVFTLDTAFQRRWNMRLVENQFDFNIIEQKELANTKILDTSVTWKTFLDVINNIIVTNENVNEDKRIGIWFINKNDLNFQNIDKNRNFAEKVIKYLWDDAFKYNREEIFDINKTKNSLEQTIKLFLNQKANERFDIFNNNVKIEFNINE